MSCASCRHWSRSRVVVNGRVGAYGYCRAALTDRSARPYWRGTVTEYETVKTHATHGARCSTWEGRR